MSPATRQSNSQMKNGARSRHPSSNFNSEKVREDNACWNADRSSGGAVNDPLFAGALEIFIKEEQQHSRYLAAFMESQSIPRLQKHWVDRVFRKLRGLAGLELSLTVLVTAEIHRRALLSSVAWRDWFTHPENDLHQNPRRRSQPPEISGLHARARNLRAANGFSAHAQRTAPTFSVGHNSSRLDRASRGL